MGKEIRMKVRISHHYREMKSLMEPNSILELAYMKNTTILLSCPSKVLDKHCLQFRKSQEQIKTMFM